MSATLPGEAVPAAVSRPPARPPAHSVPPRRRGMTRRRRRLWIVLACGLGLGSAAALALTAFSGSLVFSWRLPSC